MTPAVGGFNGAIPCAPWGQIVGTGTTVVQNAGALIVTPHANTISVGGCDTIAPLPFDDSGVFVAIEQVVVGAQASTSFDVAGTTSGTSVRFNIVGGMLSFADDNSTASGTMPYSPSQTYWLRVRPNRAAGQLLADVATDGKHWTPWVTDQTFVPQQVSISITASEGDTSAASPGRTVFRSFNVCPP